MATATTNKRIKSATDDTEGRDLISELPEEIIHQVLRRIASPAKAARTTALSRRWRSVWSCYPVLKFRHSDLPRPTVDKRLENFKKFVEASIERVTFNEEETGDNTSNPTSIDHFKYCTDLSNSEVDKRALLKALFRAFSPLNFLCSCCYQVKLIEWKCRLSAIDDEQKLATRCLSFFGPLANTPTFSPSTSNNIPADQDRAT
ncbi:F-box/LRR-repeat protein At5g02910 [Linum perenne]